MDGELRRYLEGTADLIEETLNESSPASAETAKSKKSAALSKAKKATGLLGKAKDTLLGFLASLLLSLELLDSCGNRLHKKQPWITKLHSWKKL